MTWAFFMESGLRTRSAGQNLRGDVGVPERCSRLMEAGEGLPVGGDQSGLDVVHAQFLAVAADDGPGLAQVAAGHAREQVVLDLVGSARPVRCP